MSFQTQLSQQLELLQQLQSEFFEQTLEQAVELISGCLQQQSLCSSAAMAAQRLTPTHLGELVGRFLKNAGL